MGYDEQLSAAKFRAERDQARQECERLRARMRDSVPREAYERRRTKWLRQIRECETALHRRREYIKELENAALERRTVREEDREAAEWVRGHGGLEAVEARLMPDGMEWPRYESGDLVLFGDEFINAKGNASTLRTIAIKDCRDALGGAVFWKLGKGACAVTLENGERVKRPAPKVLDADGEPIHNGETVYHVEYGTEYEVREAKLPMVTVEYWCAGIAAHGSIAPSLLTHRAPVLAADGRPLRDGETVWDWNGDEYVVERIYSGTTEPDFPGHTVACRRPDDIVTHMFEPSQLTHQRPVLDAEGVPIKGGDTIYSDGYKDGLIVDGYQHDGSLIVHTRDGNHVAIWYPQHFTHAKPEPPDSWERLEKDANAATCVYFGVSDKNCGGCGHYSWGCAYDKARDLVRRARALAERGR